MIEHNLTVYDNEQLNHTVDQSNPHGVNKVQIDLGNVENFGVASLEEAIEGLVQNKYMTPILVKEAIESYINNGAVRIKTGVDLVHQVLSVDTTQDNQREITIPMQDFNKDLHQFELRVGGVPFFHERYTILDNKVILNPSENGLTQGKRVDFVFCYLEQVGNINLPINGVNIKDGTVSKSKLDTSYTDFIDSRAEVGHTHTKSDITDLDLNHTHSKSDVGLGNVPNYGVATLSEAVSGAVNNKLMTPLRVDEMLQSKGISQTYKNISGSDLDNILDLGFYMGASLVNSPTGVRDATHWFYVVVMKHSESFASQMAYGYGSEANSKVMYTRCYNYGAWTPWEQMVTKSYVDEQNASIIARIEALENK